MDRLLPETLDQCIRGLANISRAITSDLPLADILKLVVMVAARTVGADICSIWRVDSRARPPVVRLEATQAVDPDYMKDRLFFLDDGAVGRVAAQNRPMIIADVRSDPHFKEKEMARKLGLVSMLGVPVQTADGRAIGVLTCFTGACHDFSKTEIHLMAAFAQQAAVAIFNAELTAKTRVAEEELETRKLVDRAKEILMLRRGLSGDEAYRWLRKRSMDSRKTMRAVAEAILLSEDLGYYSSIPHALDQNGL